MEDRDLAKLLLGIGSEAWVGLGVGLEKGGVWALLLNLSHRYRMTEKNPKELGKKFSGGESNS